MAAAEPTKLQVVARTDGQSMPGAPDVVYADEERKASDVAVAVGIDAEEKISDEVKVENRGREKVSAVEAGAGLYEAEERGAARLL